MKRVLVVGRPNVGKTLFTLNFAEYLGRRRLEVCLSPRDGVPTIRTYTPAQARAELVDDRPHRTLCSQSVVVGLARGKTVHRVVLVDSTGLTDEVHPSSVVRRAMADTLRRLMEAELVLHLVDPLGPLSGVDRDILRYGQTHAGYAVLANKMDLPGRGEHLDELVRAADPARVFGVSSLTRAGFDEVKAFVRSRLHPRGPGPWCCYRGRRVPDRSRSQVFG